MFLPPAEEITKAKTTIQADRRLQKTARKFISKTACGCHGKDLVSGSAPSLKEVGGKLKESEIKDIVENGRGGMPGGLAKGEEAEAVAKWLAKKK